MLTFLNYCNLFHFNVKLCTQHGYYERCSLPYMCQTVVLYVSQRKTSCKTYLYGTYMVGFTLCINLSKWFLLLSNHYLLGSRNNSYNISVHKHLNVKACNSVPVLNSNKLTDLSYIRICRVRAVMSL